MTRTLDYTSDCFGWFIWGGNVLIVGPMAILWLKTMLKGPWNHLMLLIILYLLNFVLFMEFSTRFWVLWTSPSKDKDR